MKFSVKTRGTKVNKLDYTTFELDDYNDGDILDEEQTVSLGVRSGVHKSDTRYKVFLFDVVIQGKLDDATLRELHLDVFFEFSFEEDYTEYNEIILDHVLLHYLEKVQEIVGFVSNIDQMIPFSIKNNIDATRQKIAEKNMDILVDIEDSQD